MPYKPRLNQGVYLNLYPLLEQSQDQSKCTCSPIRSLGRSNLNRRNIHTPRTALEQSLCLGIQPSNLRSKGVKTATPARSSEPIQGNYITEQLVFDEAMPKKPLAIQAAPEQAADGDEEYEEIEPVVPTKLEKDINAPALHMLTYITERCATFFGGLSDELWEYARTGALPSTEAAVAGLKGKGQKKRQRKPTDKPKVRSRPLFGF